MLVIWKRTSRTWPGRDFGAKCDVPGNFLSVALKSAMKICVFSFMLILYTVYIYIVHVYTGVFSKKMPYIHTYIHVYTSSRGVNIFTLINKSTSL